MFSGLFQTSYKKINFEDLQHAIKNTNQYIIINTLPSNEQDCLIKSTTPYEEEERAINELLNNYENEYNMIIKYLQKSNTL